MNVSTRRTRAAGPLRIVADGHDGSPAAPGGNLPPVLTSFVGREREISEVGRLLAGARLLTLTGPGGCGKTRLALRLAVDLGDPKIHGQRFADGTWWVGLSPLSDAGLVPNAVASAMGVSEAPDRALTETLAAFLGAKDLVLVLDNCEHLVEACARLAVAMLGSCPGLKILATSREPLGVTGEVSWPVPPLSLPEPNRARDADDLQRFEAIRLFVERARAASPGFVLAEENSPAVVGLCRRLDGMPLAIELAASRVRVLSPSQIASRLDDRFRLLRGGRLSIERHRTLRATIDWSHDLLSKEEKIVFRRLSVFAGGFTLEAAEEICAGGAIEESRVLELLSCLVDKSLVIASHGGDAPEARYRMLQTIRQYAMEKLEGAGEAEDARRRHADHFLSLAEEAEPAMAGSEQTAWLERLETEHDNMRAALAWLGEEREAERGLRLAAALLRFWWFRGHLIEGRARLEALLDPRAGTPVGDAVRARALYALAVLIYRQADYVEGDWAVARSRLEEALTIFRDLGDEQRAATVLQDLGKINAEFGDGETARSYLDESLEIGRRSGNEPGIALSLCLMGVVHFVGGERSSARVHLEESLARFRRLDDKFWINASLVYLGYIACEEGEYAVARSLFVEMDEVGPLAQIPWGATYTLEGFARLAAAEGRAERALKLAGATAELRRNFGVSVGPALKTAFRRSLEPSWQALDKQEGEAYWEEGRKMTLEEALTFAREEPETQPESSADGLLSARETEVLGLVADGLTDAQVAEKLYVSPRTVGGHLRGAYRKLGVKSRTAAVKKVRELALIQSPPPRST